MVERWGSGVWHVRAQVQIPLPVLQLAGLEQSDFTSLGLCFPICKTGLVLVALAGNEVKPVKYWTVPGISPVQL